MPEKNNLNCRIWVSNPKEKEAVLGLDPGIKMLGRSNRDVKKKKKRAFFPVRCIIPLFHPPIGVYTRYFLALGAIMDFSRVQREKSIIARLEI